MQQSTSQLNSINKWVWSPQGESPRVLVNAMAILSVLMYVCMYVYMSSTDWSVRMRPRATRKRSRPCFFRSLRSPTNALHSPSIIDL